MHELTEDDEKRIMTFFEESRRYDEICGTITEEQFMIEFRKVNK